MLNLSKATLLKIGLRESESEKFILRTYLCDYQWTKLCG